MTGRPFGPGSGSVRRLLFERLADPGSGNDQLSSADGSAFRAEVEASVAREISNLLNTRVSPEVDAIDPAERTVLDYGLPDITALSPRSEGDRERIERMVERAIRAFEPRIAHPQVAVVGVQPERDALQLSVSGTLTVNAVSGALAFDVTLAEMGDRDAE